MNQTPGQELAQAFYSLGELEFMQPDDDFSAEHAALDTMVERAQSLGSAEFHAFSREMILAVSSYCQDTSIRPGALYRAFDGIDDVLEIDYLETRQMMPKADSSERLYEGGGVGVQTSYSTIMKVLEYLQLAPGAHLVDLGSGFGRVGLATGLWREDLRFSGYEYVNHRIDASNASAVRAGIEKRVRFMCQDLSDTSFQIPAADVFYLYDPFSASTYQHVGARLSELARLQKTTVVAKAGARKGLLPWMKEEEWSAPESIDEGTILVFRSR